MKDIFNLSLVQLFYDILMKTQKYIKPPPKLHDTDHAPNVADIVTRFIDLITKATQMQMLQSGREVITVNGNLPNNNFQAFISNLTLEDLYVNSYHNYPVTVVTPEITATNTTAGRQLLNSIGREFPSIHSSLEIENTTSVSVDITQLKIDMQFKMHSILDITDKKCIQDSTLLPVKKKFMFYYWFAYDSNVNYVQLWTKIFRPFMNQEHSTELKAWESEVNQATVPYDEARENSFRTSSVK
ncbi:unnamed protein product [Bathycoccus prasinos]